MVKFSHDSVTGLPSEVGVGKHALFIYYFNLTFFGRIRVADLFSFLYFDLFVFVLCLVFNVASALC